jgi:high affinity Mn2+ porin
MCFARFLARSRLRLFVALLLIAATACAAQATGDQGQSDQQRTTPDNPSTTVFPHPNTRWYVAGQANIIEQGHPAFPAKYSGPNSLKDTGEVAQSRVFTLYTGVQATHTTEILFDAESAGGRGISDALGLAGFTNLDVVRNPDLGATPYVARILLHQIVPLSSEKKESERTFVSLATELPVRRLEFYLGKFSLPDFFDVNAVGSDSHLQFMNWTVDNNGAYDYAADTRGYTYGVIAIYQDRAWGVRFAEALMPKVANGLQLDWNLRRARAENIELDLSSKLAGERKTTLRLLSYVNHADMGDYREAVQLFLAGRTPKPDIVATRKQGTIKYGFGVNVEQEITGTARAYGRFGWNEGRHESFAYTEVNQTVSFGADWKGNRWGRKLDRVGAAFVTNAISKDHQNYLALGGLGFLLGDGALSYGRENIVETYYTAHLWRGVFGSFDLQHINNPGYNRARGPVWVPALRLHVDF